MEKYRNPEVQIQMLIPKGIQKQAVKGYISQDPNLKVPMGSGTQEAQGQWEGCPWEPRANGRGTLGRPRANGRVPWGSLLLIYKSHIKSIKPIIMN